jgi:DNA helicase HerA-like ATPase
MTRTLHNRLDISNDLSLPLDVVTGTEAILATKGMGKTHLAQVIAEELLDHSQVFIAIDPTDAWWGLRSSADGKHDGYPVTIFGGRHADMKLDPNAGIQIADLVIAGHSVVVCTRGLEDDEEVAIVTAIMKRLYRKNREPRKIFLDEADMFAPERLRTKGQAESLGAVINIVKRGRNSGLGITLITQRSASISKDVLNLCDTLFVLGMESPLDIEPIERWIRTKDPKKAELATELVDSLPVLEGDHSEMRKMLAELVQIVNAAIVEGLDHDLNVLDATDVERVERVRKWLEVNPL